MSKPRDYSSQTYSPGSTGPVKSYPTNCTIDPAGKSREKDDMVGLNDKFVRLIDKMKHLEDENKKLDTKLKILKEQEDYDGKIDDIVNQLESEMEEQIGNLLHDREKLQAELLRDQEEVEDTKKRYEQELIEKSGLESEFIIKKKDVDEGHLEAVDLVLELEDVMGKLDFLRVGYDEEIKELQSHVQNETVVLRDNRQRSLDMDEIVEGVKNQYANVASRTRKEAEQWNQTKMDAMVLNAGQREQEVRDLRREISDLVRHIQRRNGDLEALRRKEESLLKDISDMRTESDDNLNRAREDVALLEEALRRAKLDLAGQVREYQSLMSLKLALDIEIATYRKLLEGEEQRMNDLMRNISKNNPTNPSPYLHIDARLPLKQHLPEKPRSPKPTVVPAAYPASKKRLLIRLDVEEGRVVSESSHYTED
ncbi:keratin, type II cytoskeletal 8-like isoform X1 [Sebastes umbrosus]|uniref:keratin, type II cytoskeletal 8-like isoform X1 n=1 Tax=Sebastes umbrosus TaxID=72105 RepID=UPI0018A0352A|nr:keratin, type II cytoskeletal 8-like isoform X1 [Sebastes umbrosus]